MADELKPCPFCGGAPTVVDDDSYGACYVFCGPCDVMPEQAYRNVGETAQAIAAWNRRAAPEPSEAEIQAIAEAYCERKNISDYRLTPQDVYEAHKDGQRAARAEALEEAAKHLIDEDLDNAEVCAAAIRALKEKS